MPRDAFYKFLELKPTEVRSALRLYIAFAATLLFKITRLKAVVPDYPTPCIFVPGTSLLHINARGVHMSVRPIDLVIVAETHEPITMGWFKPRNGQTVVNIGAHIGLYALLSSKKGARTIAVEPDRESYNLLKQNVDHNGFDTATLNVALSDSAGFRNFYLDSGMHTGTSSLEEQRANTKTLTTVECITLDQLVKQRGLEVIDWLIVDVEGHELHVLQESKSALSITKRLIIEVSRSTENACLGILNAAGFKVIGSEKQGAATNWLCERNRFV
ncbi:MAG: FkbM family methyltransferase [Nitrososphaerota archaeon]|nr:FkbM family methyltransferase [Ferrimicrobium acidiphilum]MDG6933063.1 FkbM family methyltransferase [Nitrososphaerota archaeon]